MWIFHMWQPKDGAHKARGRYVKIQRCRGRFAVIGWFSSHFLIRALLISAWVTLLSHSMNDIQIHVTCKAEQMIFSRRQPVDVTINVS